MSCHEDQGTAAPRPFDADDSNVASDFGNLFLQVMPEDFTRTELHKLLDRTRDLSQYGIFDETKRDLLVDLAETLDLLDALAARDELDIMDMEAAMRDDPHYVPHIGRAYPQPDVWMRHVTHNAPPCGPNCPYNED